MSDVAVPDEHESARSLGEQPIMDTTTSDVKQSSVAAASEPSVAQKAKEAVSESSNSESIPSKKVSTSQTTTSPMSNAMTMPKVSLPTVQIPKPNPQSKSAETSSAAIKPVVHAMVSAPLGQSTAGAGSPVAQVAPGLATNSANVVPTPAATTSPTTTQLPVASGSAITNGGADANNSTHVVASSTGGSSQPQPSRIISTTIPARPTVGQAASVTNPVRPATTFSASQSGTPISQVPANPVSAVTPLVTNAQKLTTNAVPGTVPKTLVSGPIVSNVVRPAAGTPQAMPHRPNTIGSNIAPPSMRPMTTPAAQAQAQYNLALQARAAALAAQGQTGHPQQQYIRTQPVTNTPRPLNTYVKTESQTPAANLGLEPMKIDGASKDVMDEAESERTRLENRERKKRWREANEDRNKDNDLRCRVNKRAHKLYGKEPSKAKDLWIEEEFSKRKSKRQEKEGKGPDGNLLIEGTDLVSLNHFEMNSVIMSTLSEFATNPAAPALKDNADLNSMLHRLRTEPQSIRALFTGQPKPNSVPPPIPGSASNALTSDNMQKMDAQNGTRHASSALDEDEDDEDKYSQNGSITNSVVDMTAGIKDVEMKDSLNTTQSANAANLTPSTPLHAASTLEARRFSTASTDGTSQHLTYGIGSGFEPQVALALSSELFRLISMQPTEQKSESQTEQPKALPIIHPPTTTLTSTSTPTPLSTPKPLPVQSLQSPVIATTVKQEIQA